MLRSPLNLIALAITYILSMSLWKMRVYLISTLRVFCNIFNFKDGPSAQLHTCVQHTSSVECDEKLLHYGHIVRYFRYVCRCF